MSDLYSVKPLARDQVSQAYPLINIFDPDLDHAKWVSYAEALLDRNGNGNEQGILTVQTDRRHIFGISGFRPKPDLQSGWVLEIENSAVVDISASRKVAKLLLKGLEDIGHSLSCSCVTLNLLQPLMRRWLRDPNHPGTELFRAAGFRGEQLRLRKCF